MTIQLSIPSVLDEQKLSRNLAALVRDRVASRIFEKDATLWGDAAEAEAAIRLGWTDFVQSAEAVVSEAEQFRDELRARGVDRVVLCGMGGSSLAPAVICRWAGVPLDTIDSTHPAVVKAALQGDLARTVVVVSSKSGGTIETLSHRAAFMSAFREAGLDPAQHMAVVTDPGSALEADARAAGQRVFLADPNVGGRFSALTAFGLVPSVLAGADARGLVAEAQAVRELLKADTPNNPAFVLAASIMSDLPEKYVLGIDSEPDARWGLGSWIEQLVAESTGKDGKGVLPIALPEDAAELQQTPANTRIVRVGSGSQNPESGAANELLVAAPLGAQLLLWETATAVLGRLLDIDPFNQPDVESAKVAARAQLEAVPQQGDTSAVPSRASVSESQDPAALLATLRQSVPVNGYVAIQAYLDPQGPCAPLLNELRNRLAKAMGVPVALGWGPSYLHSTGQLHKGGPALGAFLQITEQNLEPLEIPGSENGFDTLIAAQARGDRDVLRERGRTVLTLASSDPAAGLRDLLAAL
ncbi:glucose-6-phosphate isomerase [Leucobacter viscericola]|uniref:Glucose-6-phosphate isomerase n=1 Tax=Leucobacter viscericola TaxID=2714935 RepID=A0A6G7XBD1_9MICO|nr:glucose-6-phosphate isomerase [Leucobacter viscericola]QIK61910.1 glucose-6-phosphate isomerase [Leucobacter viscericola]